MDLPLGQYANALTSVLNELEFQVRFNCTIFIEDDNIGIGGDPVELALVAHGFNGGNSLQRLGIEYECGADLGMCVHLTGA